MDKLNGTRQGRHIRINSPLSCFTRLGLVSFGWGDVDLRRPPSVICLMFLHFSMACLTRTTTRPAPADADPIYLRQWNKKKTAKHSFHRSPSSLLLFFNWPLRWPPCWCDLFVVHGRRPWRHPTCSSWCEHDPIRFFFLLPLVWWSKCWPSFIGLME